MRSAKVISPGLHMRKRPNGQIMEDETLSQGDIVETFERRSTATVKWVRVRNPLSGETGWVTEKFLQWVPEQAPPPDVEPPPPVTIEQDRRWPAWVKWLIFIAVVTFIALIVFREIGGDMGARASQNGYLEGRRLAQTSWCMRDCGRPPTCEGVLAIRNRLDAEARAKGWTDEFPKNYWRDAAEERERLIRDYCK